MECKKKLTTLERITFAAAVILFIAIQIALVGVMKISLYLEEMTAVAISLTAMIWTYFKFCEVEN
jgi:membrane protein YdbS with pleckstrin-like domain